MKTANKERFIAYTSRVNPIFKELGAIRTVECWGDDIPVSDSIDFRKAVQLKDGETVCFSWFEWPNKATRDTAMARVRELAESDERLDASKFPAPIDAERLISGGFEAVVEI